MNSPLVSVIIPFYSGREWLGEALESVFNQTYKNYEVLLINDGSKEDISLLLDKYSGKIKYFFQENRGAAAARNSAIEYCLGEYIAFLDSDDIWLANKLEIQIQLMQNNNSIWSHTNYTKFDYEGNEKICDISHYKGDVFPLTIISNPIATPTVIIKRKILLDNPHFRFEETMKYGEDTILWLLLSLDHKLLAVNENLTRVRLRGFNSANMAIAQISARSSIWKWLNYIKLFDPKEKIPFCSRLAFKYCTLVHDRILNRYKGCSLFQNDLIVKLIYAFPWLLFKLDKYLLNRRKEVVN